MEYWWNTVRIMWKTKEYWWNTEETSGKLWNTDGIRVEYWKNLTEKLKNLIKTEENEQLTIEKLKKYPEFENVMDEEVEVSIDAIERLSNILFQLWMEEDENRKGSKEEEP